MKTLLAICMILAVPLAWSAGAPATLPPSSVVTGEVLEVKDVESYTYLRLKTKDGETWAAVGKAPAKKGATVTIVDAMLMHNFESKSLKRTFPTIVFGTLGGAGGMSSPHPSLAAPSVEPAVHVAKASGANARTIAEITAGSAGLKDKPVLVRGKVVKYNPEIMGKNWIHLRDGTGSDADRSNDLLVTSTTPAKLGDVVTVQGIVRTNKDFGSGYSYKVLVEEIKRLP